MSRTSRWLLVSMLTATFACGGESADSGDTTGPPPQTGAIRVSVATTGPHASDSYSVTVDGVAGYTVSITGSVTIDDLDVGDHQVGLTDVPQVCAVSGDNPSTASVSSGATTAIQFTVSCVATTGSIEVELVTTGEGSDPSGYSIVLDGGSRLEPFPSANGTAQVLDVAVGPHTVELSDVATNCQVEAPAQQNVDVTAGGTARAGFAIQCAAPPPISNEVFFFSERSGPTTPWIMNPDGTGSQELPAPGGDRPDINSDGSLIAYGVAGRIVVVQPDGNRVADLGRGFSPSWSPDDSRLAFSLADMGQEEIWTMLPDGSDLVNLTDSEDHFDTEPDWSRRGQIAFTRQPSSSREARVFVMNQSGGALQQVTNDAVIEEGQAAWSPNGDWLLLSRLLETGGIDIWVIRADLTELRNLTNSPGSTELEGTWSPDGTQILFASDRDGDFDLFVINLDGTGLTRLNDDPGHDGNAAWGRGASGQKTDH